MGLFDDLIPKKPTPGLQPEEELSFDDLVPSTKGEVPPSVEPPVRNPAVQSFIDTQEEMQGLFDDLIPKPATVPPQAQTEALTPTPQTLPSWLTPQTPGVPTPAPATPEAPTPAAPQAPSGGPNPIMRGLVTGSFQQNPELGAEFMELLQHKAPEATIPSLQRASGALRDLSKLSPQEYALRAPTLQQLWSDPSVGGAIDWAGETLGQGISSMGPSIAAGLGGGAVGGSVAGPPGALVGGLAGAGSVSYGMGAAEVYKELKKEGVDPKTASDYAFIAGVPIAALDVIPLGPVLSRMGGTQVLKQEVARSIARRIASEGAKGMTSEGVTEAAQEAIKIATVSATTDKPFWSTDNAWAILENGVGGALTGGVVRGGTGIKKDVVAPSRAPAAPDAVDQAYQELTGTPAPVKTAEELAPVAPSGMPPSPPAAPPFISTLKKTVEDKGPNSGDAAQWKGTILNAPGVKMEEYEIMGMEDFLDRAKGPITKQDILTHLEENTVDVDEVFYTDSPREFDKRWAEGQDAILGTHHRDYIMAGDVKGYHELLLTTPIREGGPEMNYRTEHFNKRPNILAHVRMTERRDINEEPTLLIEEIQSDWHQEGARVGYRTGPPAAEIKEAAPRGWHFAGPLGDQRVPDAPFKSSWQDLALKRTMRWAADRGYRRIALVDGATQGRRYTGASPKVKEGLKQTYDKVLPSRMKYWAKKLGGTVREVEINIGRRAVPTQLQDGRWGWTLPGDDAGVIAAPFYDVRNGEFVDDTFYAATEEEANSIVESWVRDEPKQRFIAIDIPPTMATNVQGGLPLFSESMEQKPFRLKINTAIPLVEKSVTDWANGGDPIAKAAIRMTTPLQAVIKMLGLRDRVKVRIYYDPNENHYGYANLLTANPQAAEGFAQGFRAEVEPEGEVVRHQFIANAIKKDPDGKWGLNLNVGLHTSEAGLWGTAVHELGHIFMFERFASASTSVQNGIIGAYRKFREENPLSQKIHEFMEARDNVVSPRLIELPPNRRLMQGMAPEELKYWAGFDEWAAEQVARWATTSLRPVTAIERFFENISRTIRKLIDHGNKFGKDFRPSLTMQTWLDSFASSPRELGIQLVEHVERVTKEQNQAQINKTAPEVVAEPRAPELQPIHDGINKIFDGNPPPAIKEMGAWADKFNKFYKWSLSVVQLAALNPHIEQLQRYVETMRQMHLDEHRVQEAALRVAKAWRGLGPEQAKNLTGVIDEIMNFTFLTDQEKKDKVRRHPTRDEFGIIVDRYKLSRDGIVVFQQIRKIFADFLTLNEQNLEMEANRITDPVKKAEALDSIRTKFNELRKAPYFPSMRFGTHTVVVRDAANNILHFELVEGTRFTSAKRVQRKLADELAKEYALPRKFERGKGGVQVGVLAQDARPMLGMPGAMLDLMMEKLELSQEQRQVMEQLKFEASPAQSFKHRFRRKNNVAGYSEDFQRAFANYFFHGAKFYTKVKYAGQLREYIKGIRDQAKFMPDYRKRMGIANYVSDHLQNTLDPKPDFAALRGMMFTWALGFSPAAATLNLTQIIVGTYPYLASKFGDRRTVFQMGKAGLNVQNFYRRGTYEGMTDFHWRAISEGIKQGTITEAMAPELAALTDGRNLGQGFGGNSLQRAFTKFQEMSSFMFEMTEQMNRRITFRAGLELALADPNNKHIDELVGLNRLQYERLIAKGWSVPEARAYLVAQDAVNTTQYEYARWAQPRFMRGKMRTVFVFKTFIQNTMFLLANNPSTMWRSMLVMAYIGGVMGLPGADDIDDLLKGIAYKLFGKDFDLRLEARRFILDISNGKIPPDLLLHGMSRRGFGIPAILDGMGNLVGRGTPHQTVERFLKGRTPEGSTAAVPFPMFDRSKAVGFGRILPIEIGKLFQPMKDVDRAISQQVQNASGAAFGVFFNAYRAIADTQLAPSDPKRWERAVPRALGSLSRSYRAFTEGRERNRSGATVVNYDIRDPEQFFEALALAGGYNNIRQSAKWDRVIAEMETQTFWDIKRSGLLKQYFQAEVDLEDLDIVKKGIEKFNKELPEGAEGMAITPDTIKRSMQARARAREAQESGVSIHKTKRGLQRGIQELFPESTVDVRKVR